MLSFRMQPQNLVIPSLFSGKSWVFCFSSLSVLSSIRLSQWFSTRGDFVPQRHMTFCMVVTLGDVCVWCEGCSESVSQSISSVAQSCPTICDPMNRSMPGLPVHHQFLESTQTYVHWVSDAIQSSHPPSSPSPPALNLSQHHGLFKWVSSSHQVAIVLEFHLKHQSFQRTPRTDLL